MEAPGHGELRHARKLCQSVQKLLKRAEGAEPAAKRPTTPEQQADHDANPQDEDQRLDQEILPLEIVDQHIGEGKDVHDRKLGAGVEPEEAEGEKQVENANAGGEAPTPHEPVLKEEQAGQPDQRDR